MRAVVLGEDGTVALGDVAAPALCEPGEAIVRVRRAGICGSDLHVKHGRVPGATAGTVMGHEFTGIVEQVGDGVASVRPGARVVGSFVMPCGRCPACLRSDYHVCDDQVIPGYGLLYGDLPGAQAERVRVRNADLSLLEIPAGVDDERALLVGDNLTTAFYANRLGGVGEGMSVAVQGCGPVGLLAVEVAVALGASPVVAVDVAADRLAHARGLGAATIDASRASPGVAIEALTGGGGVDVVLDAAGGAPAVLVQALDLVRPGGQVVVVGVYSDLEATLPLAELWVRGLALRFAGTCPVPALWREVMDLVEGGQVDPRHVVSHRLPLADAARGYELFEARDGLKVVLEVEG